MFNQIIPIVAIAVGALIVISLLFSMWKKVPQDKAGVITGLKKRVITGGGGLVWGLDKLIAEKTGIPVMIAEDAQSCVAIGTGKALDHVELFESGNAIKLRKY